MSEIASFLKKESFSFVIPRIDKLAMLSLTKKDKVLGFIITKGYVEASSLEACYYFSLFLDKHCNNSCKRVGNIDRVRLDNDVIVFRQRIFFTDLNLLLKVLDEFQVSIIIPDSFRVGISTVSRCITHLGYLSEYCRSKKLPSYNVEDWLTDVCILQLYKLVSLYTIDLYCYKDIDLIARDGILLRAPYLCSAIRDKKSIIFFIPKDDSMYNNGSTFVDLLSNKLSYSSPYTLKRKNSNQVVVYGYSLRNIKRDRLEG